MEFTEAVRRRRMARDFDPERPVPEQVLARAFDHATRAPSAGFSQGWDFVLLTDPGDRTRFWATTTDPAAEPDRWLRGVRRAPCLIICCSDPDAYLDRYAEPDKGWVDRSSARWPIPYWDTDTAMAALLILLTATDAGLGGLFFGVPAERHDAVRAAFGIPARHRLVGMIALGHPVAGPPGRGARRGRRRPDEVVHRGRFGHTGL